jgi:hypothetical protein
MPSLPHGLKVRRDAASAALNSVSLAAPRPGVLQRSRRRGCWPSCAATSSRSWRWASPAGLNTSGWVPAQLPSPAPLPASLPAAACLSACPSLPDSPPGADRQALLPRPGLLLLLRSAGDAGWVRRAPRGRGGCAAVGAAPPPPARQQPAAGHLHPSPVVGQVGDPAGGLAGCALPSCCRTVAAG